MCSAVASSFADATRYSPSSPNRDTARAGRGCTSRGCSNRRRRGPAATGRTTPSGRGRATARGPTCRRRWSRPTCSNWNTMSSSPRAASVNRRACSTVAPGVSPTVSRRSPNPPSTSRCISAMNSWIRGPLMKYGDPSPYCDPSATSPSGRSGVLRQHVDDVHAEAVDAAVEPPAHHLVDRRPYLRVLPVEVGLLPGEQVEVVLPRRRVELPHRTGEVRLPVGGLGSRRARLGAGPPGRHQYQSRLALSTLERDSTNHGCSSDVWLTTRSITSFMPRSCIAASSSSNCSSVPNVGSMSLVVADVVAVVVVRRPIDRRQPDDVDAEVDEVVELVDDPAEIADTIAVAVGEAARIDLVDGRRGPPRGGASTKGS